MQDIATDRLIGRDTAGTGDPEQLTVGGGVEFTTAGGIQRSALTGDVTASAGSASTTIVNNAVTYAKMQDVSAASKLLGRGDSGSGDPQEITLGSGLSMTGTTLSSSGGGSALTVEEVDGSPTDNAVTKLVLPNGTLSIVGHVATYTPTPGGGIAPDSATYVVEDANGSLSAESVLGTTVITRTAYASRQAAAKAGRLHFPTDGFVIGRDNGSSWNEHGPIFPLNGVANAPTTWVNQGAASIVTTNGAHTLICPADAATTPDLRIRKKSAPSTPYTVTVCLLPTVLGVNFHNFGIGWRQSSDGKLVYFRCLYNNGFLMTVLKSTGPTNDTADYVSVTTAGHRGPIFLKIADDNTNRICSFSANGQDFVQFHSVGRTDFLTGDEVFFAAQSRNTTHGMNVSLLSWVEA